MANFYKLEAFQGMVLELSLTHGFLCGTYRDSLHGVKWFFKAAVTISTKAPREWKEPPAATLKYLRFRQCFSAALADCPLRAFVVDNVLGSASCNYRGA